MLLTHYRIANCKYGGYTSSYSINFYLGSSIFLIDWNVYFHN